MSDPTLVKILGNDIAQLTESFNTPMQHDGEYMTIRAHALHIISTQMYHNTFAARLHHAEFCMWNPVWKERLATDLEFLGYSVSFDNTQPLGIFADSFLMEVKWSKKAQTSTYVDVARETRMNPQFSDSDSDVDDM